MLVTPRAITLDDITGGTLQAGTIPAPRFRRAEGQAENAALVTVLAGGSDVVTLDLGTVVAGDRILACGQMVMAKGVTAGATGLSVVKAAGTATIVYGVNDIGPEHHESAQPASSTGIWHVSGVFRVTLGGTLTLRLLAFSLGSNGSVVAGDGELYAWVIPGS